MNAKRGINNIISGIGNQVLTMAISLIVPRLVLVNLGSEVNGLTHSITSFFTYFSLLEAGVGKATRQALYKPLAEQDMAAVNRIMAATDRYYRRTGYVYSLVLLLFAGAYTLFTKSSIPAWEVFTVITLTGASSILSYFVQGKYRVLMETEGKSYILVNISSVSSLCTSLCKIALLLLGLGIVPIQGMYLFFSALQMVVIVVYIRRYYKWLNLRVEPDYKAIAQKNAVLLHQVTGMIFNNTDMILLTVMTNLKAVSVYSMYTTFYTVIGSIINTISYSFSYAMGQIFHRDKEEFARVHDIYELYNMALTFSLMCILHLFILPFMKVYTAGVTDANYLDPYIPLLFTTVYLLSNGRASSGLIIDFAQHFKQTRGRAILEAAINISTSIIGIWFFGIYGGLLGTIAALLYRANDMILYANKLMDRSPWITYKRWLINLVVFVGMTLLANAVLPAMDSIFAIILWCIPCCAVIIPVFVLVGSLCERKTAANALQLLKTALAKKGQA